MSTSEFITGSGGKASFFAYNLNFGVRGNRGSDFIGNLIVHADQAGHDGDG